MKLFVFDVESIGLHGEGFAVAGGIYDDGNEISQFCFSCDPSLAIGDDVDRYWVANNIPPIEITHESPKSIRDAFWEEWIEAKNIGALAAADCCWPVESNFLSQCIDDDNVNRRWNGPYPLIDISTLLLSKNIDPLQSFDRLESELPVHHPLSDARQSARIAFSNIE